MPFDPTAPLTPSGNLRRRAAVSRFVQITATAAAAFAVAVLVIVCYGVAVRGASALSFGFVVKNPSGLASGGIFNALLGTLEIVAFGALIALPLGVLTGALPDRVRRAAIAHGAGAQARARHDGRPADDRRRPVRLRADRDSPAPAVGVRRRRRARDRDAAADRAVEPGGAAAGAGQPARGRRRARREPLADGPQRDPADRARRDPHRCDPGHRPRRRRDRPAADLRLDLSTRTRRR